MVKISDLISFDSFESVVLYNEGIELENSTLERIENSFSFLKEFAKNKIIYGVNTGFGPMAQYRISEKDQLQLQYNLIRSHSAGMGEILSPVYARAVLLARLQTLSLGNSGVHISVINLMKEFINKEIYPVIHKHGGVGASGDLVQLAHLALGLIGEGKLWYKGEITDAQVVFKKENIQPIEIHLREGLALINGTSVMTGIGLVNIWYAKKLLNWSILTSALINEIVQAFDDHFSEELNGVKKHQGQQNIAKEIRGIVSDSKLIRKREDHLYTGNRNESVFKEKVQEYYSLRCVPQILGPIQDTINQVETILINEVNSANDNPIVDINTRNVYHGGNFHGDYVSLEMDKLRICITKLSMLLERQLNYLLNPSLNEILPAFVNLGTLGLNFGMQAAQFTATSTTAENQTLATPIYTHSIPNNKDNQDIVSMGTNAALLTEKVIDNTYEVLSIYVLTLIQAVDYLKYEDEISEKGKKLYTEIRKIVPKFDQDDILSEPLMKIKEYLKK
ncbi:histidine ammonia-lyase [Apibacter sp. HY039]|uniref:HAL/PAL/TAL family ammonia-lyase n=1 Tax=Apibacter sp. HY039 TaxID=2501476 RepID=UPI000FEBFC19|nr:aromatic amino acid ammonia-lyase [Apibacter sp. HY039]